MQRVYVFVDGFNIYHAINSNPAWQPYKWLDLVALSKTLVPKSESIRGVIYCTALATWLPTSLARHKNYIKALELTGVHVVYGQFKVRDKQCSKCGYQYKSHEEKQTDVNIATWLFRLAAEDRYDKAIIISGDSDLIPAVQGVKYAYPAKEIAVAIPIGRKADELKQVCDRYIRLKLHHLQTSRLPEEIDLGGGKKLLCPTEYRLPKPTPPPVPAAPTGSSGPSPE